MKISLYVLLFSLPLLLVSPMVTAQPRVSGERELYPYPWAGGLNAVQFGRIDLDMDGTKDLIAFDRTGNRLIPFLVKGGNNFTHAPEYADLFPRLYDWMILADYNGDGLEDIFTYSVGKAGILVYKNVSTQEIKFELIVTPFLTSFQGGGYTNILVTYADYPAIYDLDGDGDLDILTFWGLGTFVEHHKNLSIEKYGHADSLDYEKIGLCWGYFGESEESNVIYLDTCFGWKRDAGQPPFNPGRDVRHTGSTFQLLDFNDNGVQDLLLGDVDYATPVALTNGGTIDSAYMIAQDWNFPPGSRKINLFSMPVTAFTDVTGDGVKDLLVSPFDPNPFITQNFKSIWLYENTGTNTLPDFDFRKDNFLQEGMIDVGAGAYPVFADYDGDGLDDLFIGNYGYYDTSYYDQFFTLYTDHTGTLNLFLNTGTASNPSYQLYSRDIAGISEHEKTGIVPAFSDLDGDGDLDLLLGYEDGLLMHYENMAGSGNQMNLVFRTLQYKNINVGRYSTPCFFDLDGDGREDLIIGERGGNLNYYRKTGAASNPAFTFVTDSLGEVNVIDPDVSLYGFSVPVFFDEGGETGLLVGSEQGHLYYFTDIDGNLNGKFTSSDDFFKQLGDNPVDPDRGYRTAAAVADIDNDGDLDLVAGNFSGGLEVFIDGDKPPVSMGIGEVETAKLNMNLYPNPATEFVQIEIESPGDGLFVRVYGQQGELLMEEILGHPEKHRLYTGNLKPGLYLVAVFFDDGSLAASRKLMITE